MTLSDDTAPHEMCPVQVRVRLEQALLLELQSLLGICLRCGLES